MPSTIRLHRVLRATPQRVCTGRSLIRMQWSNGCLQTDSPGRFTTWTPTFGGSYKMSFKNFTTGKSHAFGGEFVELVPHERIRYTDKFEDPNLPGAMKVTIMFKKVSCGTAVNIPQEGVSDVIPAEACDLGWQESLILLAKLVEAEISDNP